MDSAGSEYDLVVCSCKHGNDLGFQKMQGISLLSELLSGFQEGPWSNYCRLLGLHSITDVASQILMPPPAYILPHFPHLLSFHRQHEVPLRNQEAASLYTRLAMKHIVA